MPSKWMKWLVRPSFCGEVLAIQSWEGACHLNPIEDLLVRYMVLKTRE